MVILPLGPRALDEAAKVLADGGVVVLPTDTVYGLAVNPFVPGATERLFAVKRRPHDVDLPVLVSEAGDAAALATDVPDAATALMQRWWPGPLTLVLRRQPGFTVDLGARSDTIGLRCPAHETVRHLAMWVSPLAITSANRHREPTPRTALEVAAVFGDEVDLVVDGGVCDGAPSTVVDATGDELTLLREGAIPWSELVSRA